jgi:hypothetical protein
VKCSGEKGGFFFFFYCKSAYQLGHVLIKKSTSKIQLSDDLLDTRYKQQVLNHIESASGILAMATLFPPPSKRQKLETANKAREQQEVETVPADLGSIRVQFFDQATGKATGPAVAVPVADASVQNLELLLNTLQGNVGTLTPESYCRMRSGSRTNPSSNCRTITSEYHTVFYTEKKMATTRSPPSLTSSQTSITRCLSPA